MFWKKAKFKEHVYKQGCNRLFCSHLVFLSHSLPILEVSFSLCTVAPDCGFSSQGICHSDSWDLTTLH